MADQSCANCQWRAKYDARPKSFLGRLWRWHIRWCPGWKAYIKSLSEDEKTALAKRYNLKIK